MEKYFGIAKILLKLQARDRVSFVWNFAFPIVSFLFIFHKAQLASTVDLSVRLSPFIAWVLFQMAVYGVGLRLVSWREVGLLKSLVFHDSQKQNLVLSLVTVQVFFALVFVVCIYLSSLFYFGLKMDFGYLSFLLTSAAAFVVLYALASLFLATLRLSVADLQAVLSVVILPLAWLGGQQNAYDLINKFNPMFYFNDLVSNYFFYKPNVNVLAFVYFICFFFSLAVFGYRKLILVSRVQR